MAIDTWYLNLSLKNTVYFHLLGQYGPVLSKQLGEYRPIYSNLPGQDGEVDFVELNYCQTPILPDFYTLKNQNHNSVSNLEIILSNQNTFMYYMQ